MPATRSLLTLLLLGALARAVAAADPAGAQVVTSGDVRLVLPLGLQADAAYLPPDAPLSAAKIALGRALYFDPRLSRDRSIACATCHHPYHGYAEPLATSKGVGGLLGMRNAPTVLNRLFSKEQFWDGRAADLEAQAHGPLTNPREMAMASDAEIVGRVKAVAGYAPLFTAAFGTPEVTMPRVTQALAAYERTVLTGNSAWDRRKAGDADAMSPAAVRGMALFEGKANCAVCHAGFNFTDEGFHNIGVGMDRKDPDLGRFAVTGVEADRGAFKTPTLRNLLQTAPYMHDGSEPTLRAVVEFYDRGGVANPWLSKEMRPLQLTGREKDDLVAFLEALQGDVTEPAPPPALPR